MFWRFAAASSSQPKGGRRVPVRNKHTRFISQFEPLEDRRLLSGNPGPALAKPVQQSVLSSSQLVPELKLFSHGGLSPLDTASPTGLTPSVIRHAYGFDQVVFTGGVVGDGTGQTIAIVDAYHAPTIQSDLHSFDVAFGLPDPPSFVQVAQDGSTNFPSVDPAGAGAADGTWELEEALDVEWAHALAPGANILLVEANSPNDSDLINAAADFARRQPNVVAVSMSFGGSESQSETSLDSFFTTPAGHNGVTFLSASGDDGRPSGYPGFSPNVVAVGGTTLTTDAAGNYLSESGWSGSGGSVSTVEPQPSYQAGGIVPQSSTRRANPDVAFDADPASGVPVYDSYDFGTTTPWAQVGGTSFSTPAWAAIVAVADQGRQLDGLGSLDGATQTLPLLYQLPASSFHDITTGNNGFAAAAGYDLVTGLGTPKVQAVVGGLIGSSISGTVFADANSNGMQDPGEIGLPGVTVFDDLNSDGVLQTASSASFDSTDVPQAIPDSENDHFDDNGFRNHRADRRRERHAHHPPHVRPRFGNYADCPRWHESDAGQSQWKQRR